ncbi:5'-nucleotidase [Phytophthora palmivora]|uniref:5'-nucleotidase n=1 Tax=Phytophthora palmivora TaxID=4796 RepID=A0A2P4YNP3_9STRA|nr:5'-nucleotidase [Phytophthora palmivora]
MCLIQISTQPESFNKVVETFLASHVPTTVNEPPNYEQLEHALEMAYDRRQGRKLDGKSEEQALYEVAEVVEVEEEEEVKDVVMDHVFTVKNKDIKFVIVRT